jgi:hypothetical protein
MEILPFFHPITGGLVVVLLVSTGVMGLRLRGLRPRDRGLPAARHARAGRILFGLILASWAIGFLSTVLLRPDLAPASTLHFRIGSIVTLLASGSWFTSRAILQGSSIAREWHPWLGATALVLAAAQTVTGLQLTP